MPLRFWSTCWRAAEWAACDSFTRSLFIVLPCATCAAMSRTMKALLAVWIVVLAGAAGWIGWDFGERDSGPPLGAAFTRTDQDGKQFSSTELKGKPTLLYFGYTYCPDVCPTSLLLMENAAEK